MELSFDHIIEVLKVAIIPLLVWIATYMKDISRSLVSLKNDINDIKTNLATASQKHDDLKDDVEDIKKNVILHTDQINEVKVNMAKIAR